MSNILETKALNAIIQVNEMIQEKNFTSMAKFFDDLFNIVNTKINNQSLQPEYVEATYVGLHINETYEESDFLKMLEEFKNNKMIHAKYAMQIFKDAIRNLEKQPNVSNLDLNGHTTRLDTIIVGDLHGNFRDLYFIIQKFGVPGKKYRFVFNGDFVDRGNQQCEVLLTLLFAYLLHPKSVFLNRGNHEDLSINVNTNFSPNFKDDVKSKFNQYHIAVFNQAQRLFRRLPLATIVHNKVGYKVFVCHGGVSERMDLEFIKTELNRFSFASIILDKEKASEQLSDLMWSDPLLRDKSKTVPALGCSFNAKRGIGCLFGEDVSKSFCEKNGFDIIVRSHELRKNGFSLDHPHCYTVFSASGYCYGKNKAAVLILGSQDKMLKEWVFETEDFNEVGKKASEQRDIILKTFKNYLESESKALSQKFTEIDTELTGWIDVHKWAEIVSNHVTNMHAFLNPIYLLTLKDYICPCDDERKQANYVKMFSTAEANPRLKDFVTNTFNLIDVDHNGVISYKEAKRAIKIVNKSMGTDYDDSYILSMDTNDDKVVDYDEFFVGFSAAFNCKLENTKVEEKDIDFKLEILDLNVSH